MEQIYEQNTKRESLPEHLQQASFHYPAHESLTDEICSLISSLSSEFGIRVSYFPLTSDPGYSNGYELLFANGPWLERPTSGSFVELLGEFREYLVENY
jgi:hypothetical protein